MLSYAYAAARAEGGVAEAATWQVEGDYFESCNCEVACPCTFLSMPSHGYCDVFVAWRIEHGRYGRIPLDGLAVVAAFHIPGHIAAGGYTLALYLDDRATPEQLGALEAIFSGRAGGGLKHLARLVSDFRGARPARIAFMVDGRRRSLRVDDVLEARIEALPGRGGAEVVLMNAPAAIAAPFDPVVAKSEVNRFSDHGLSWDNSGTNGFYSRFRYQA